MHRAMYLRRSLTMASLLFTLGMTAAVALGQSGAMRVDVGALQVRGPLGRVAVQEAIERSLDAYRACLGARGADAGRLSGELHLRVHVEANGVPIAASVDWSNVGDRPLERCLVQATEAWRLVERSSATVVSFTLRVGRGAPSGDERDVGAVISLGERADGHLPAAARNTQPSEPPARAVRRTWTPVESGLRVQGALSEARVAQVLRARARELRRCVTLPTRVPGAATTAWEVFFSLRVGASGRLSEDPVVRVEGAPLAVSACLAGALRDTRFPRSQAETQVVARYQSLPGS